MLAIVTMRYIERNDETEKISRGLPTWKNGAPKDNGERIPLWWSPSVSGDPATSPREITLNRTGLLLAEAHLGSYRPRAQNTSRA